MAIEIKIPEEINRYETKFVGPFSLRQTICLGICVPMCIGLYVLLKPYVGVDLAGFLCLPPAGVGALFGWYKPYGMKFEKYLQTTFINVFVAPSKRYYKTENYYASILKEIEKEDELFGSECTEGAEGKPKKVKKKKYKRSKMAIK